MTLLKLCEKTLGHIPEKILRTYAIATIPCRIVFWTIIGLLMERVFVYIGWYAELNQPPLPLPLPVPDSFSLTLLLVVWWALLCEIKYRDL